MIYIVYFQRAEVLLNRIGENELQCYADLKDFLPLLEKRGTVIQVEPSGEQIDSVYQFTDYLGEAVLCLSFSPANQAYHDLQCPKALFPAFIPPPVWNQYHYLSLLNSTLPKSITTHGPTIDSNLETFLPKSIVRTMPWLRSRQAAWQALKKSDLRLAIYYLFRRNSVHYFPVELNLSGVVYTALVRASDPVEYWKDLINEFCQVFKAQPDVSLVIKMVGEIKVDVKKIALRLLKTKSIYCRVIIIQEHLPQAYYDNLIGATSFFINLANNNQINKAVLEFMSAGRPVISIQNNMTWLLDHTNAFLINSSKKNTFSSKEALIKSYQVLKNEPDHYRKMSRAASQRMQTYCSLEAVEPVLSNWLDQLESKLIG